MPTNIAANLLYAGHAAQVGDTLTFAETWISHNLRPDLSTTYLPDVGDFILSGNIISDKSIMVNKLADLRVRSISENEYIEGDVRGMIYSVLYDDQGPKTLYADPTSDDKVVLNISSGAQVDSYTKDPDDKTATKLYVKDPLGGYLEAKDYTTTKISTLITVSTTKRYRSLTMTQVIAKSALAGNTNAAEMWGQPIGCVRYEGASAAPIQEIDSSDTALTKLTWNITNNYSIKYIPGFANQPAWDHVWYAGYYTRLYNDNVGNNAKVLYPRTTLPNDLA